MQSLGQTRARLRTLPVSMNDAVDIENGEGMVSVHIADIKSAGTGVTSLSGIAPPLSPPKSLPYFRRLYKTICRKLYKRQGD